ncbi:MAG: PA0069 family radical SAM protein [Fuerstiella sp.]|jgi:DNA repair photolyase|nr:PA0069 family radical SAM protein [Fuerstiella sp.]MCP4513053.1 PA0069 family radical SAM protein [Fuerstiella sp.]MDG2126833.1 PA0069 family radical SAM protein [Fuerstiella sp.]
MTEDNQPVAKGRGAAIRPQNRFVSTHSEPDLEQVGEDREYLESLRSQPTQYLDDNSKSIVSTNDSRDVFFRFSVNPYRGCAHGCSYCYARPTHEYLGLDAGLDFETKIFVKHRAPTLFQDWLARESWQPEYIAFSGVTDCYQPAEKEYKLTRGCLEVALDARQPIGVITKNALIARDIDLLARMSRFNAVSVAISITTLDSNLAAAMEPRTSTPHARLRTIRELTEAGIPVTAMVAPIVPGLTDSEVPAILESVATAGAKSASYIVLRLPWNVRPVFLEWLERTQPSRKQLVESRIRSTRNGALNAPDFGGRMRGEGEIADQICQTFRLFARKHGLDTELEPLSTEHFRRPTPSSGQLRLF